MKSLMNLVALGRPIGLPSIINAHKGKRGTLGAIPVFCFDILNGVTGRSAPGRLRMQNVAVRGTGVRIVCS